MTWQGRAKSFQSKEEDEEDLSLYESGSETSSTSNSYSHSSKLDDEIEDSIDLSYDESSYSFELEGKKQETPKIKTLDVLDILFWKMFVLVIRYHKELCVLFLLFASGISIFRTGPLKTRSVNTPIPFFSPNESRDYLEDNYRGEYVELSRNKIPYNPSFVFYYAPWDSESVEAKSVFLAVAKHFYNSHGGLVKFYAVNCWWLDGQCRQNFKNLSHYPIFVGHITGQTGVIYGGPIRKEAMVRFMELLLKPITRIDTEEEFRSFRTRHDAVILGYVNFNDTDSTIAFDTFLQIAMKNCESDPFGQIGFGLFLKPSLAEKYYLESSHSISLVLFNEIHTAKWQLDETKKGPIIPVIEWATEKTKYTPMTWAYQIRNGFSNRPISLGPNDFVEELQKGPVFLLITRRLFPISFSPFYHQMREIAIDYFNCNKSVNITRLRRDTHKMNSEFLKSLEKACENPSENPNCEITDEDVNSWNLMKHSFKREALAQYEQISMDLNFTGSACRTKSRFRFLAIDPSDIPHFIQLGLGLDLKQLGELLSVKNSDPLAFIIDAQNDVMVPFKSFNISNMIIAIDHHTNKYMKEEKIEKDSSHNLRSTIQEMKNLNIGVINKESPKEKKRLPTIQNFNSDHLIEYLKSEGEFKDTSLFILFTAKFCGYCGVSLAHFIHLAKFLQENYNLRVTLAKIETYQNILPKRLNPAEIPSFVYFDFNNRTEGRMFPTSEEINSRTLLRFILSQLKAEERVSASLASPSCIHNSLSLNKTKTLNNECLNVNKVMVSSKIQSILRKLVRDFGTKSLGQVDLYSQHEEENSSENAKLNRLELLEKLRTLDLSLHVS